MTIAPGTRLGPYEIVAPIGDVLHFAHDINGHVDAVTVSTRQRGTSGSLASCSASVAGEEPKFEREEPDL